MTWTPIHMQFCPTTNTVSKAAYQKHIFKPNNVFDLPQLSVRQYRKHAWTVVWQKCRLQGQEMFQHARQWAPCTTLLKRPMKVKYIGGLQPNWGTHTHRYMLKSFFPFLNVFQGICEGRLEVCRVHCGLHYNAIIFRPLNYLSVKQPNREKILRG